MPLTADMRRDIDLIRNYLFGGGYPNPMANAEQLSFLFFFYLIEGIDSEIAERAKVLKQKYESIFAGTWTLKVADEVSSPVATGTLTSWQLKVYGYNPACRCDWNLSGAVSLQDLFDYLGSYFANKGDFSGDGTTTVQDIFDYLACWFQGC